ncbi:MULTISPECIES: hypothetical protein [Bacillus]|uniref:Uncharacterized protein n=1 Tax=Bacillus cereus TaxID=1396 RepID=A0A9X6ZE44_BACCE|nr:MULTISPECIES: hypothetical protein [Bacillus cereus group]PEZ75349.1 hypothetical protein CN410_14880 [Bacillus anthracis]KXY51198.1 hypothetical protein AT268_32405 [Bacillus cereus]PFA29536.1 hypothetical protein CN384_07515 [Bacillus thuringiensis]PFF46031.1 hypothetical protein CN357_21505 [Bacillus cereus]PFQ36496.1 hypothetical protein COK33_17155 [Bacillus cereus]
MLLKQLNISFEENEVLRDEYPPNLFIPMLEVYIRKEIYIGYNKICPIRLSKSTGLPEKECIRLFLGLSDNKGLIDLRFYVFCPNCNKKQPMNLDSDEEFKQSLLCKDCMQKMKFSEEEIKEAIKCVFYLNKQLFLYESNQLKNKGERN